MNTILETYGSFDNYMKHLLETYGHTKEQWNDYIKRTHTSEIQSWRGSFNSKEQQAIKGKKNTAEQQSIKGQIGGKNNTSKQQSLKGKQNTSEQQSLKGKKGSIKSAQVRFEGSNEQLKPWLDLGISRSYYYKQKKLGLI